LLVKVVQVVQHSHMSLNDSINGDLNLDFHMKN